MMRYIFFFIILLVLPFSLAQEFPSPKDIYVNDYASFFSSQEYFELRSLLSSVRESTTAEVVVVVVNSTTPYTPAEYRTKLFNEWGIGDSEKDNGLLIVYSVSDKRIEVEVGYGLEGILPDSKVGRMLDEYYIPLRDQGNVTQGIILFSQEISKELELNKEEVMASRKSDNSLVFFIMALFIFVILFIAFVSYHTDKKKKMNSFWTFFFADFLVRLILMFILGGRGRSGGGSTGGFGGGGFGGGGSGGGGAGR